jgi:hypothetical protein
MIRHLDLGNTPEESKKSMGPLIRSGAITLGGYKKNGPSRKKNCPL